jgi:nucleotide-binding universal stress UspA family protein
MYKRILLAYDGSSSGQQALVECRELAQWSRAELILVAVIPNMIEAAALEPSYFELRMGDAQEERVRQQLDEGLSRLQSMGFAARGEILHGEVIRQIAQHAQRTGADLIVVGHRHESSVLRRWWSGSTAKSLVEEAPCSVLIVVSR